MGVRGSERGLVGVSGAERDWVGVGEAGWV